MGRVRLEAFLLAYNKSKKTCQGNPGRFYVHFEEWIISGRSCRCQYRRPRLRQGRKRRDRLYRSHSLRHCLTHLLPILEWTVDRGLNTGVGVGVALVPDNIWLQARGNSVFPPLPRGACDGLGHVSCRGRQMRERVRNTPLQAQPIELKKATFSWNPSH